MVYICMVVSKLAATNQVIPIWYEYLLGICNRMVSHQVSCPKYLRSELFVSRFGYPLSTEKWEPGVKVFWILWICSYHFDWTMVDNGYLSSKSVRVFCKVLIWSIILYNRNAPNIVETILDLCMFRIRSLVNNFTEKGFLFNFVTVILFTALNIPLSTKTAGGLFVGSLGLTKGVVNKFPCKLDTIAPIYLEELCICLTFRWSHKSDWENNEPDGVKAANVFYQATIIFQRYQVRYKLHNTAWWRNETVWL